MTIMNIKGKLLTNTKGKQVKFLQSQLKRQSYQLSGSFTISLGFCTSRFLPAFLRITSILMVEKYIQKIDYVLF